MRRTWMLNAERTRARALQGDTQDWSSDAQAALTRALPHGRQGRHVNPVAERLQAIVHGTIRRCELPNLWALQFTCERSLGGGVTTSLALDAHGKSLSYTLLEITIQRDAIQTLRTAGRGAAVVSAPTALRSADRRPAFPGGARCHASRRKWLRPCTCTECPGQPR
jgi:hypothetical protein